MKRVIKFRAWDMKFNKLILLLPDGYRLDLGLNIINEHIGNVNQDWVFQQFTGLNDGTRTKEFPEGKEIYEGDILTTEHYPFIDEGKQNYVGVVEMVYGCWQYVLHLVNKDKSGISDGVNSIIDDDGEGGKGFEIIGNIYENPELLESK